MPELARLCVYCGSSRGRRDAYAAAARAFARAMVERGIGLVYGGSNVGIMAVVAGEVLRLGGTAIGVIPEALVQLEHAHPGLTELHVTPSMHARKTLMAELADGFAALPGGVGTLEELFEIWTWAQLGFHAKPCGLLNVDGYYDALIAFLDHATGEEFIRPDQRAMLLVEPDPVALLERLTGYRPASVSKWIGRGET
jgi:uncharacterized protein (TIGR00730 family)